MGSIQADTTAHDAPRRGRVAPALAFALGIICLLGLVTSARAAADTLTVSSVSDSGGGSLRAAVAAAEGGDTIAFAPGLQGETIELVSGAIAIDESLTIAGPGPSRLTIDAGHASRIFEVTAGSLSISGLAVTGGVAPTDGGITNGGAIAVSPGAVSLTVSDCAFSRNSAGGDGGSDDFSGRGRGGAIDYRGTGALTVSRTIFTANSAGGTGGAGLESGVGRGGAINVSEPAVSASVSDSQFTANTAGGDGGGGSLSGRGEGGAIRAIEGVPVTVAGSVFSDNFAGGADGAGSGGGAANGGAVYSFGKLTVSASTFDGNAAGGRGGAGDGGAFGFGGAIHSFSNQGALTVTGSTFTENTAGGDGGDGNGGAISVSSLSPRSLIVTNSTLVANAAGGGDGSGWGGAIDIDGAVAASLASVTIDANAVGPGGGGAGINRATGVGSATSVTARAAIVSQNTGASSCNAPAISASYSLEGPSASDTSCGFDLPSADAQLGPLADNGGPTATQALPRSSPAVAAVPLSACPTIVDQRGQPRAEFGEAFCDIGAFELVDTLTVPPPPGEPVPRPQPQPPNPDVTKPVLGFERATLRKRTLRLPVSCPRTEARCSGRLWLTGFGKRKGKAANVKLGTIEFELVGGASKTLSRGISHKQRRALRTLERARLRVKVEVVDVAGNRGESIRRIRLKRWRRP